MISHIGVKLPNWGPLAHVDNLASTARAAEQVGFASLWVADHIAVPMRLATSYPFSADGKPPFAPSTAFQEPMISLAWAGAVTGSVQLATGVLVAPLRNPLLLAKQAATLDSLSGGRLVLGLGAGWLEDEFTLLERPFRSRSRDLGAAIEAMRCCWSDVEVELPPLTDEVGRFAMEPKPVGRSIPVLIGGNGPRAMSHAAERGDGWYGAGIDPSEFGDLAGEVTRLRSEAQRSSDTTFRVGAKLPVVAAHEAAQTVERYASAGADFVVLDLDFANATSDEVVDHIHQLGDALELSGRDLERL